MGMGAETLQDGVRIGKGRNAFKICLGKRRIHQNEAFSSFQNTGIGVEHFRLMNGHVRPGLGEMRVHGLHAYQITASDGQ